MTCILEYFDDDSAEMSYRMHKVIGLDLTIPPQPLRPLLIFPRNSTRLVVEANRTPALELSSSQMGCFWAIGPVRMRSVSIIGHVIVLQPSAERARQMADENGLGPEHRCGVSKFLGS